jgi:putative transposase
MAGIAKQNGFHPKSIGGVADHVHLLLGLPPRIALARAIQLIKGGSSAWIHLNFPELRNFAWQEGYGAFSVGISQVPETINYIEQQVEHHRTRTFQEEYLSFLKGHYMKLDGNTSGVSLRSHRASGTDRLFQSYSRLPSDRPSGTGRLCESCFRHKCAWLPSYRPSETKWFILYNRGLMAVNGVLVRSPPYRFFKLAPFLEPAKKPRYLKRWYGI